MNQPSKIMFDHCIDGKTDKNEVCDVIWASGAGKKGVSYVHAYLSEEDYDAGKCLCGNTCYPKLRLNNWDIGSELGKERTCPRCREMLPLLRYR